MANKKNTRRSPKPEPLREAPPVIDLDAVPEQTEDGEESPRIELFKYRGKTYYMAEPGANMMLRVLKSARDTGMLAAVGEMLEELIGEDTYKVLMDIDDLTNKELNGVIDRVMHFSMDRMEAVLGNS